MSLLSPTSLDPTLSFRQGLKIRVPEKCVVAQAGDVCFGTVKEPNGQRAGANPASCVTLMAAVFAIAAAALCNGVAGASGAALFVAHCTVCHQPDGQGIPGMYPPLADSAGDFAHSRDGRAYLVHVVAFGLDGPIAVRGAPYNGFMQSWVHLSDDDIAQLLNHVLTNFNANLLPKEFAPFTAHEVKRDRARPMTSSEVYRELQNLGTVSVKAEAK